MNYNRYYCDLTIRQKQCYDFIKEFIAKNNYPPTTTEICKHMNYKKHNAALRIMECLVFKGYIRRERYITRGIEVLK